MTRLPRVLLPLPRHEDRQPLRERRALDDRHGAAAGGRARSARATSTATIPSRPRSAPTPTRCTARIEWDWASPRPPAIAMGWTPEEGFHAWDWHGYDEAMIVYLLALGSPTHPVDPKAWDEWTSTYKWGTFQGQEHLNFSPLFVHQYSHVWVDFRGIQDAYMRGKGIDYFENSRRATLAQRAYAIANPGGFAGYGPDVWGLSACDGPLDADARGRRPLAQVPDLRGARRLDRRTCSTTARSRRPPRRARSPSRRRSSFLPLREMARRCGGDVYNAYGFIDAFNPDARRRVGRAALRAHRAGRRLVRPGPARHRPGPDRRHARELPFRARLEDHAPQSLHRGGLEARGVHGRMARQRPRADRVRGRAVSWLAARWLRA